MKSHVQAAVYTVRNPASLGFPFFLPCRWGSANSFRRHIAAWALALVLASVAGAVNSHAAILIWTNGNDYWQSTTAWTTNLTGGTGGFPGSSDDAFFTNAATYSVTLRNDASVQSNFFSNASNTLATVTLDLGTNTLNVLYGSTKPGGFNVGDQAGSVAVVYLASSTNSGKGLSVAGRIVVGRWGFGTLIVTNGNVSVANTILGNAEGSGGSLVLSGPNTVYSNTAQCAIGNNSNCVNCSLVISNSASMNVASTLRLGSGSSQGGCSNSTLLLDTNGRLFTHTGPTSIGNNGTTSSLTPSYNNSATVQGGGIWDNGNASFIIGYAAGGAGATGNVLTVGTGGVVTNISTLTITADNTLHLAGGLVEGVTTCSGTVMGFGTVLGNVTISSGGFLSPANALGQLTFSNRLTLASDATTTVQLGTNFSTTVVIGNLTLDGTLNVTDGGGFTNGTYTLFSYGGTLTYNGVTIGTTPSGGFGYTIDTNTAGVVNLDVTPPPPPPVADFTGSPTNGSAPLVVTFTDSSTGTITNRFWSFGDGATSNTTLTGLTHTYTNLASFEVSLTVFGPGGTDTLSRTGYITITNALPVITSGLTVTNAVFQLGNVAVVVAGDTNVFSVGATDPGGNPLNYQWSFGDGVTNAWSPTNTAEHAYTTTNCGPYDASVTISNELGTITSNFTVTVACQLNITKLQTKLNFAKTNADSCTVSGAFDLPTDYSFSNKLATLNIGGAELSFRLDSKGAGRNGVSKFSKPSYNTKTGRWTLKAMFKNGSWQGPWADYSMTNSNIPKPGTLVSDLPVILLLDTEAFLGTTNLHYTATQGKSGSAR